jgi:hypothetical protein
MYVAFVGEKINAYKIFIPNLIGREKFGRQR